MEPVKVVISAISGYGYYYLKTLLEEIPEEEAQLCGVIDPEPEKSGWYAEIVKKKIPVFADFESFYQQGYAADLAIISSPPHFHVPQSEVALKYGTNVLVEKPVGTSPEEVHRLMETRNRTGRWVEVGFQWSFSSAIQELKRDILSGRFGLPIHSSTLCFWPRPLSYYRRNRWAGRFTTDQGLVVLDSPLNNACAHFLHNLLFLLGPEMSGSATVAGVSAQCSRAYDIESYDTVKGEVYTEQAGLVRFAFSHVTEHTREPFFRIFFENAFVAMNPDTHHIEASHEGILIRDYGSPDADNQFKKLFHCIQAVNDPVAPICPPEAALPQVEVVHQIYASTTSIQSFPADRIVNTGKRRWVRGLGEELLNDE